MIIGITGGTGFAGRYVQLEAARQKDEVILFSRHPCHTPSKKNRLFTTTTVPDVNGCEGLVHLAGESIMGWWTHKKREQILESRRQGTRRLVEGIARAVVKPRVLVSASAIGYYGDRGDSILNETSSKGSGFLSDVTSAWEEEAFQAEKYGVRVVCLRFGLVLSRDGGLMKRALPIFRCGLGARFGSGTQWMSCIHASDLARLTLHCLHDETLQGVLNAVMSAPVTNKDFTKAMAQAAHRPTFFPLPAWLLKLILGDASHLLLDSQRVIPKKTSEADFHFEYPTVETALQQCVQKGPAKGVSTD